MRKKYVNETAAAKSISAYIIFKGNKYVGKIQVHHGNSQCLVDVWFMDCHCGVAKSELFPNGLAIYCAKGSARGYGYNKENSALRDAFGKFVNLPKRLNNEKFLRELDSSGVDALRSNGFKVFQAI